MLWVSADDRESLAEAAQGLGLPSDVVRRAGLHGPAARRSRPHVERLEGGGLYLSVPTLTYVEQTSDVLSGEVMCLVLDGVVLTTETGQAGILDQLPTRLAEQQPSPDEHTAGLLSALLWTLVASMSDVEHSLGEDVEQLEAHVFSTRRSAPIESIYALKREIAEARRGLVPLSTELAELTVGADDQDPLDVWLRRLTTVVDRLDRRLTAHDRLLTDMLSAHLALVSVRQNDDVRRISAWAAIAAAPTLVASVYGMNFQHMPELTWPWGYPFAIVFMTGICVVLHRLFTRSGWL